MMYLDINSAIIQKMVWYGKIKHHIIEVELNKDKLKNPPGHHGQEGFVRL